MGHGDALSGIIEDAKNGIRAAMKVMATMPKLTAFQLFFWTAFHALSTERPSAFSGAAPIPFSKIHWYAVSILRLDNFETDEFVRVIRKLDQAYIVEINKRAERESKR